MTDKDGLPLLNVAPTDASHPLYNPARKQSAVGSLIYLQTVGQAAWTPRDYAHFAKEGYSQNVIAYRCIRMITEAAISIPFVVYKGKNPVDTSPFIDLWEYPNPFEGQGDVLDSLYSFLLIAGNTYLEHVAAGDMKELYVLRPDRMKVVIGPKGWPAAYEYTVNGQIHRYVVPQVKGAQRPILHLRNFNPLNDFYGLSSIEPAAYAIDVHTEAGAYNKALLQNQAKPSGALVMTADKDGNASLTDDQFSRLKGELENQYQGVRNAGRPLLLEGGLDWKQMGLSPQDLEFTQGKREAAREIALAFGVPPMLLGIPGDNTYSNYQEANVAFYRQTVLPLVGKVTQGLTVFFKPTFGEDFRVGYDQNQVAGLSQEREQTWTRLNSATFLTVNEKRDATGYDEVEGGDEVLIQSSLIPISSDLNTPELDPETGLPLDPADKDPGDKEEDDDDTEGNPDR